MSGAAARRRPATSAAIIGSRNQTRRADPLRLQLERSPAAHAAGASADVVEGRRGHGASSPRPVVIAGGRAGRAGLSARGVAAAGGYQPPPLELVEVGSSTSRFSAAGVRLPDSVSCTADQNFEETSLYLTLVGADGRGTAFWNTSFQRGMIGCAASDLGVVVERLRWSAGAASIARCFCASAEAR